MKSDNHNAPGHRGSNATNELRLCTARKRLVESRGQEDAIDGLREIVATFLGSEELGLFKVDRRAARFQVFWSFGIDLERYDLMRALGDAGLRCVMRGDCHVERTTGGHAGEMAKAQAFVPIRAANETIAILAILRLLPQKHGFDLADMELFKLLSHEAAEPLFGECADLKLSTEGSGIEA